MTLVKHMQLLEAKYGLVTEISVKGLGYVKGQWLGVYTLGFSDGRRAKYYPTTQVLDWL